MNPKVYYPSFFGGVKTNKQTNKKTVQSADIDVIAISEVDRSFVAGECKFKNEKMDKNVYETLVRRTRNISGKYKLQKYIFFSLGGYTEWFDTVTDSNVILFTLEDMY